MAPQVESMCFYGDVPWHGNGEELKEKDRWSIEKTLERAEMDWEVGLRPLYLDDGRQVKDGRAVVRQSDDAILGVVGPRFTPLQNRDAFAFFEPFVTSRQASFETAGSLNGGRRVWILAKLALANSSIVKGDEIAKFLLLSNSHDGTLAVRVGFTPIRVVCANTLAMAHRDDASKLIRFRHSKDVKDVLEEVRSTINVANQEFEASVETFKALARRQINQKDLTKYIKIVLKKDEDEELSTKSENTINEIERLFEVGLGTEIKGVRGTWWGAYNAVTEWLNYQRGHNVDTRLSSLWFGESAKLSKRALDTALQLANAA